MPASDANIWLGMATLYAELLDLSTCINGYLIHAAQRNKQLREIMQLPDKHQLHGALLIGYPKTKYINRVERSLPVVKII